MAAKRKGKKSKSVSMMTAAPFVKQAKKPESDDKPHVRPGSPSANKNMTKSAKSARVKRLTGMML